MAKKDNKSYNIFNLTWLTPGVSIAVKRCDFDRPFFLSDRACRSPVIQIRFQPDIYWYIKKQIYELN